jgi:hypothetical protein
MSEKHLKPFDWKGEFDYPNYCRDCGSYWYNCICTESSEEKEEEEKK